MLTSPYLWDRFFCPRDSTYTLDRNGFLQEQAVNLEPASDNRTAALPELISVPCVVILGEPGMGKSTAMQELEHLTRTRATDKDRVESLDLGAYQTDVMLVEDVFAQSWFDEWMHGDYRLYLFLDSLDECLLQIRSVARLLSQKLLGCPADRLFLRIVCRTATWPLSLERALETLWGKEAYRVLEVLPLRRWDVIQAAEAAGLPSEEFLSYIESSGLVPLAARPITLKFLLSTYATDRMRTHRVVDLYRKGCQLLCAEPNQGRREAGQVGSFSAEQRLQAAERMAFLTVFANRAAIWLGEQPLLPVQLLSIEEIIDSQSSDKTVNESLAREVLSTGLFNARGIEQLGWAHQTYADFLAASYLARLRVPLRQVSELLIHPLDADKQLIPQLSETALWLAQMRNDVLQLVLMHDPLVLFQSSGFQALDDTSRSALVEAVLQLFDTGEVLDTALWRTRRYSILKHSGLANQLRPYITKPTHNFIVRRVAIDIAEECNLAELQAELIQVALDPGDNLSVRTQAAWAITRIGDDAHKSWLMPLIFGLESDEHDELKGCALMALWPNCLSAHELFAVITEPKQENLYGSYKLFLNSYCLQALSVRDLPQALQWASRQPSREPYHSLSHLADAITHLGWTNIDADGVLSSLADAAYGRLEHYVPVIGKTADTDDIGSSSEKEIALQEWILHSAKRRRLAEALLPKYIDNQDDVLRLVFGNPPLLYSSDLEWILLKLRLSDDPSLSPLLAKLAARLLRTDVPEQVAVAYEFCQANAFLATELKSIFDAVELDSEAAQTLRDQHQRWKELKKNDRTTVPKPPPDVVMAQLLERIEGGDIAAWWRLNHVMLFDAEGKAVADTFETDLRQLPGWKNASPEMQARILAGAFLYVFEGQDNSTEWLGRPIVYYPALAGYRALLLLLNEGTSQFGGIPAAKWQVWAPIVVAYPMYHPAEGESQHQIVALHAYRFAQDEVISTLTLEIMRASKEGHPASMLWKFESCWDERFQALAIKLLKLPELNSECFHDLLEAALRHSVPAAVQVAIEHLPQPINESGISDEKALVAADLLVEHMADSAWAAIWQSIQQFPQFGRDLLLRSAYRDHRAWNRLSNQLGEQELADLYIWVVKQFPHSEDPQGEDTQGWHAVTPREDVGYLRDGLLNGLVDRGTAASLKEMTRIVDAMPELAWLKWRLTEAKNRTRQATWEPLHPETLLALVINENARLIQTEEQLLQAICDTLAQMEAQLRAQHSFVLRLWNEPSGNIKVYRPKLEERFSEEVYSFLNTQLSGRGIIPNCEVQVQTYKLPGFTGQRLDIKVDAISEVQPNGERKTPSVVIEVKGSWNPEVETAMEHQLRNRYLRNNGLRYGLYLIGWFNCDLWDDADGRKGHAPRYTLNEARARFASQAEALSTEGYVIKSYIMDTSLPRDE